MAVWETEDESVVMAAASLPTPTDTPYRTPSRNSRKSRRSVTPPGKNPTPPPMPSDKTDKSSKRSSRDLATDQSISILDPRRFTPTLHANLVSEILTLRRDQEEKTKIIESLETALHATGEEHETVQTTLLSTAKENRSLKRQLALLEGGTSSALGELARERDEAIEAAVDAKKRLDSSQKKLRSQEDDSQRVHDLWAKEKYAWEEEKRKYERKLHVAESRLKMVLDEVATYQAAQNGNGNGYGHTNGVGAGAGAESEAEEHSKETDAASVRTMSMTNSIRFSMLNGPGGAVKLNGNSLADELNFDGDDDYETDYGGRGRDSVLSNHHVHMRNPSRDSAMSRIHRRNQSNDSLIRPGSVARGRFMNQTVLERLEDVIIQEDEEESTAAAPTAERPKFNYTDSAVQYSPPPSPKMRPVAKPATPEPPPIPVRALMRNGDGVMDSPPRGDFGEVEANQRRKRIHIARPLTIEAVSVLSHSLMVSSGSQTVEEPLSPPRTPKSPLKEEMHMPPPMPRMPPMSQKPAPPVPVMVSSSTQTDIPAPLPPPPQLPSLSQMMQIPSISIHPPTSRPSTPREPRLPQLFKDFGCQVSIITASASTSSIAVQTEEIRVDKRLDRLPVHLHPSSVTSRPNSPAVPEPQPEEGKQQQQQQFSPVPGSLPPRNPRRLTSKRSLSDLSSSPQAPSAPTHAPPPLPIEAMTRDAYPGNNDDGPLSSHKAPIRRPHRISSLFAGFDAGSSDEADEFADGDLSDSEFRTALSAPRPKTGSSKAAGKRISANDASASASLAKQTWAAGARSSVRSMGPTETYSKYAMPDGGRGGEGRDSIMFGGGGGGGSSRHLRGVQDKLPALGSNRSSVMRKAAMIQNGIATHHQLGSRARSPSLPTDPARDPPFPIPTRASSRRPPISASAPSDGRSSPTRRGSGRSSAGGSHSRANSIRKVRSAAVLSRNHHNHNQRHGDGGGGGGGGGGSGRQHGSRSPPPLSPSIQDAPGSPTGPPPLPHNDITTPRNHGHGYASAGVTVRYRSHHSHQPSTNTADTDATGVGSVGANSQQAATGVVDAIAQTMVGEWMFKYVRRRKSFGVNTGGGDNAGKGDDTSNDRHKRWVWLAPYERAILWSSKQPVSGSALMGKSGRKLTIQSVLDVKDDNPPPKGAAQIFNRSILILTPQRALKFTAINSERHYLWLTALSFLAHSQQAVPEIVPPPPSSRQQHKALFPDFDLSSRTDSGPGGIGMIGIGPPSGKPKRAGIRDSIRLAKGKTAFVAGVGGAGGAGGGGGAAGVRSAGAQSVASSHTDFNPPSLPGSIPGSISVGVSASGYHPHHRAADSVMSGGSASTHLTGGTTQWHHPQITSVGPGGGGGHHQRDLSREAAEPPFIPRFHDLRMSVTDRANQTVVHGRKRSNTGGHVPPPLSFRGFSGPIGGGGSSNSSGGGGYHHHASTNSTAAASIDTTGSSGVFGASQSQASSWGGIGIGGGVGGSQGGGIASQRTSEASSRPSGANFFDAIGTVRMEAFISPLAHTAGGGGKGFFEDFPDEQEEMRYRARRRSKELRRRASRSRRREGDGVVVGAVGPGGNNNTNNNRDSYMSSSKGTTAGRAEEDFFRDDPFRGF